MPSPTGNRWRDPDTGEIANPHNVDLSVFRGAGASKLKLGPAVFANGPDPAPEVALSPVPEVHVDPHPTQGALPPELGRPKLGPALANADAPPRAPDEDQERLVVEIKMLGRETGDTAKSRLAEIAQAEYARPEGPRTPVTARLSRLGYGRPKDGET